MIFHGPLLPGAAQLQSGATAYTLVCDAGSYTLSGQNATLIKTSILVADAGAYTLTGQDATLIKTSVLSCDAGSFALTGQDATLRVGRYLSADAGSFTLTGQDVGLTYTPVSVIGHSQEHDKKRKYKYRRESLEQQEIEREREQALEDEKRRAEAREAAAVEQEAWRQRALAALAAMPIGDERKDRLEAAMDLAMSQTSASQAALGRAMREALSEDEMLLMVAIMEAID